MNRYKIIVFMGKSGAGKDTIQNAFCDKFQEVHKIVSTTTRPPRQNEVEGSDYFFVGGEEFAQKLLNYEMVEASDFRDWFYGTELKALDKDKINVGVFNPDGVRALLEDGRIDLMVVYVMARDKVRIVRALDREEDPDIEEIFRRFKTDLLDFSDLDFNYIPLINDGSIPMSELIDGVREQAIERFGQIKELV